MVKTKLAVITSLIRRPEGASVADLVEATGWQAKSVYAAISNLKKNGLIVDSTQDSILGYVYKTWSHRERI